MDYTHLGRTGLKVSRLCLGTMNFGPQTSEPDTFAIMDRALEHGINFFDTANLYGWRMGAGHRESTRTLPSRSSAAGSRRAAAAGTRSSWPPRCTADGRLAQRRRCPPGTSSAPATPRCAGCRPTTSTCTRCTTSTAPRPWDEIWQAMESLVAQGKILYVGLVQLRRLASRAAHEAAASSATSSAWSPSSASTT